MDLASQNPDINYIGFEMYDSVLVRALQKMEERAENGNTLPNVFFCPHGRRENFHSFLTQRKSIRFYLNFSDPSAKRTPRQTPSYFTSVFRTL